jgi:hypothetical protein
MTDALLTALKVIYDAITPLKAALPHYRVSPAEERVPLKTLIVQVPTVPGLKESYSTAKDADIRISFTVFEESGGGGALIEQVIGVYDVAVPSLTGADCSNVSRATDPFPFSTKQKSEAGNEVWGWSVEYVFSCHKP